MCVSVTELLIENDNISPCMRKATSYFPTRSDKACAATQNSQELEI